MKDQDLMYQHFTGCSNGLQLDCFDTRFAELRPKWEGYLKRGLVYPRKFIVLESSPNARKYNQERCALNVMEEKKLAKDWDSMYQHFTSCSNGLQLDCFDTRFAESKPKWEGYLKRGLVYPRRFIVLESFPNAR